MPKNRKTRSQASVWRFGLRKEAQYHWTSILSHCSEYSPAFSQIRKSGSVPDTNGSEDGQE
jgi:hypothetical protein